MKSSKGGILLKEVARQEKKYLITIEEFHKQSSYLEHLMMQDTHNGARGYMVRSLYFDSIDDKDFYEKIYGLDPRRKIRLRYYGPPNEFAVLELKQKQGIYQVKKSLKINIKDAIELTKGNYSPLLAYSEPFAAECYGIMNIHAYRPKTIVEYSRKAFIARENKIRLTFDHNIRATESSFDIFSENLCMYPVLDIFNVVLEVKYDGFLLSYIKSFINSVDVSEISISKYCLGRLISLNTAN